MSTKTDCLIQQANCGRIAGEPVCPKCGVDEQVRYTTQEAVMLAQAQASAKYRQNEAAEVAQRSAAAEAERKEMELQKAEEAKRLAEEEKKIALTPKVFQDHPTAPQMVVLPSGSYLMGEDGSDQHQVTIAYKLAMGRYPVTFAEWNACVVEGGTRHKPGDKGWGRGQRPVINVSWDDAQAYIAWLNKRLGIAANDTHRYRLPSEAEWEYACRAGRQTQWCFGDDEDQLKEYAWYVENSGDQTHPVGQKKANTFGLHDMHGNVWEWVQDSFDYGYAGAPSNGSAWEGQKRDDDSFIGRLLGLKKDVKRVLRGGSWRSGAKNSSAADRYVNSPGIRYSGFGFRVARTLP